MTEQEILQLFEAWNSALATGDPDRVTALYADDAVLLPTVSNQLRRNHAEIRDYFADFLPKQPSGHIDQAYTRFLSTDLASSSGIYTFSFGDGSTLTARFSYLYRHADGAWKILEHHSSVMPEG